MDNPVQNLKVLCVFPPGNAIVAPSYAAGADLQTLGFTTVMCERPQPYQPHASDADQVQVWRVWNVI